MFSHSAILGVGADANPDFMSEVTEFQIKQMVSLWSLSQW